MSIKKIIALASAKGGVGKSTLTALSALSLHKDYKVGILDADIYGPNQHILFDIQNIKPEIISKNSKKFFKPISSKGIEIASMGSIIDSDKAAIWRGPMLSGAIKQLMTTTDWSDLDILFIDMPPGTGDAYLTVCAEIDLDGVILVSTPNILSKTDTIKSINTFNKLDVPIIGYIENMTLPLSDDTKLTFDRNIPKITTINFNESIYNMTLNDISDEIQTLKESLEKIINA
ncbi:P-loop NTPase [Gammaproteobacteria bacterium]|nr:P-loop NTPase [Gammaproteobacteria bacterium]